MRAFVHDQAPGRVVFGPGTFARLAEEASRLGLARVLLICTASARGLGDEAADALGPRLAARIGEVRQHVPESDVDAALEVAGKAGTDGLLAIGGGSAVGLAKALALTLGVPIVAVPTTYSGSEMTPFYGISSAGHKHTGRDLRVLPATVVYDPALTVGLPADVTAASGMNALAHCVEALYDSEASPILELLAEESIRALARGLPGSVAQPDDVDARGYALYGAYLAGAVLGGTRIALQHRLAHVVGGTYGLPHAPVHSVLLPQVTRFNAPAAPAAMRRIAAALGADDPAAGLFDLAGRIGAATDLASLGMDAGRLAEAAGLAAAEVTWNPRPVSTEDVLAVLTAAYAGARPS
jgi:maleylacetate reductase